MNPPVKYVWGTNKYKGFCIIRFAYTHRQALALIDKKSRKEYTLYKLTKINKNKC